MSKPKAFADESILPRVHEKKSIGVSEPNRMRIKDAHVAMAQPSNVWCKARACEKFMNEDVTSKSSSCPIGAFDKCVEMRKSDSLFQVLKTEKEKQDVHHREHIEELLDKQSRELQDLGEPQGGAILLRHRQFGTHHLKDGPQTRGSGNAALSMNALLY